MALVLYSAKLSRVPSASPDRGRFLEVIKRIILTGLSKEISAMKQTPTHMNRERELLQITSNERGFLTLCPAAVDRHFSFLEEIVAAELGEALNTTHWREGFIAVDKDCNHEITKCDQVFWLSAWAKAEAEKSPSLWQYTRSAVCRPGVSRSTSIQRLKMLVSQQRSEKSVQRSVSIQSIDSVVQDSPVGGEDLQARFEEVQPDQDSDDVSWPSCPFGGSDGEHHALEDGEPITAKGHDHGQVIDSSDESLIEIQDRMEIEGGMESVACMGIGH